jgi:hypothetical protein
MPVVTTRPVQAEQDQDGAIEARVEARDQLADRFGLDLQHLAGRVARHCRQS